MVRVKKAFILLLALLLPVGCSAARSVTTQCWAYDTYCTAAVRGGSDIAAVFERAAKQGETLLNPDGTKQYYAAKDGETRTLSDPMARIVRQALRLTELTDGKFDLTVAPLVDLWDVNHRTEPPSADQIAQALTRVGSDKIRLDGNTLTFLQAGVGLDVGSVGKGYGADETVRQLKEAGAEAGVVSFGGNVATFGTKEDGAPFRIAIRDPRNTETYFAVLTLTGVSAVTSGAYERYFTYNGTNYHHLLDATTGYPCESDLLSVTVVCEDGAQADLLATALWLAGEDRAKQILTQIADDPLFVPAEAVLLRADGSIFITDGLRERFTPTAGEN